MTSGEWLPQQAVFDLVRRGYSPDQVNEHLDRLEYDLRILTADRDSATHRLGDLAAQMSAAQSEADELRGQLDRTALAPTSMAGLSDRMQRMIRLAEEEASEIRAKAKSDAADKQAQLDRIAAELDEQKALFETEREKGRSQLAQQVRDLIEETNQEGRQARELAAQEAAATIAAAQDEATLQSRLAGELRESQDATSLANRTAAEELSATQCRQSQEEAAAALAAAQEESDRLRTEATAEVARLQAESAEQRQAEEDDFDIAITARRTEAHQLVNEQEQTSRTEAERLIAEATTDAQRIRHESKHQADELVAAATAEAYRRLEAATNHANAIVAHATGESHRRVDEADTAVRTLVDIRSQVQHQLSIIVPHLDEIRRVTAAAPEMLHPLPEESDRPVAADFQTDPGPQIYPTSEEANAHLADPAVDDSDPAEPAVEESSTPSNQDAVDLDLEAAELDEHETVTKS